MSDAQPSDSLPLAAWRWLWGGALVTLHLLLISLGLIAAGVFEPSHVGERVSLPAVTLSLAAGQESLHWLPGALPDTFHMVIQGALQTGALDSGYGLVLGTPTCHVGMGVSPTGYLTLWQSVQGRAAVLLPWQPWPHVTLEAANEIWVNVEGEQISWRINGEQVWQGRAPCAAGTRQAGYWAAAYGGPAVMRLNTP